MTGMEKILAERLRQREVEKFSDERDDAYKAGELALAGFSYEWSSRAIATGRAPKNPPPGWPWTPDWFKSTTREHDLVKAGALYFSEAERALRAGDAGANKMATSLVCRIADQLDKLA